LTFDSSRPSREPLHDRISAEDHCTGRARFEANDFLSYPRPRSPTHELVHLVLNSDIFAGEDRQRQEEGHKDEANDDGNEDDSQPQPEVKDVAAALITEKGNDIPHSLDNSHYSFPFLPCLADPSPCPRPTGSIK